MAGCDGRSKKLFIILRGMNKKQWSPNGAKVLVDNFNIAKIQSVEEYEIIF